jgi:hypothetical protein
MDAGDTVIYVNNFGRPVTCTLLQLSDGSAEVVALGADESRFINPTQLYPTAEWKFLQATKGIA